MTTKRIVIGYWLGCLLFVVLVQTRYTNPKASDVNRFRVTIEGVISPIRNDRTTNTWFGDPRIS